MNIGLFTDSYYPEISGLATSISTLQTELKKRGHKVYIFTTSTPVSTQKYPNVFRLPSMPFIFFKSRRVGTLYSPRAAKCVKRLKLDLVHTQTEFSLGIFGKIMARQMGIPIVHTWHTIYKDYFHYISKGKFKRLSDNLVKVLSRNYCNGCDYVIVPTKKVYDLLTEYGTETPIKIVPTGVDLKRFSKESCPDSDLSKLKESLGINREDPVVVFVGRIAKEKSVDIIMKQMPLVLKKIPNAKFLIVGGGPILDEIKELASELKIKDSVIFTGEKSWDLIAKHYRLGDVFVSASVTETQGLTIIEAMASEVPVIAKEDRNIEQLIKDGYNGRVFKQDNEISDIVVELLNNRDAAAELSRNARKTVEEYSVEFFGKSIEDLYNSVIQSSNRVKRTFIVKNKYIRRLRRSNTN